MKNLKKIYKKYCIKCGKLFIMSSNVQKYCVDCHKLMRKEWGNKFYHTRIAKQNNCIDCGKKISTRAKRCYSCAKKGKLSSNYKHGQSNNPLYYRQKAKEYYYSHKKQILEYSRKYYKLNRQKIIDYNVQLRRNKRLNNINIRLKDRLSKRLWDAVKGNCKSDKTMKLLGCSVEFLKQHLETQFKPGMTWDNYGKWHVDHIRPCCAFNLKLKSEQQKCFNYTNLRPLWAEENFKRPKIIG